jgi:hypothetical protein
MSEPTGGKDAPSDPRLAEALETIARALRGLQFGEVRVVVQDGVVIQVDRTERFRTATRRKRGG